MTGAPIALPRIALSVRQPWAWAIVHAGKDIENRDWRRPNPCLTFRGRICVHAATGLTQREYRKAAECIKELCGHCPPAHGLLRGGIIGMVDVVDIVKEHDSPWFFGPRGLVLRAARPVDFIPCAGSLGFFAWHRSDGSNVPSPARWMLPQPAGESARLHRAPSAADGNAGIQGDLFA